MWLLTCLASPQGDSLGSLKHTFSIISLFRAANVAHLPEVSLKPSPAEPTVAQHEPGMLECPRSLMPRKLALTISIAISARRVERRIAEMI